ncbi:MAG: TadE/TadG family type IV pilus assembly protein [Rhodospirillales bacterium]
MHALGRIAGGWRRPAELCREERGNFIIELAVAMPVLVMLLLSGIELTRFVLVNQRVVGSRSDEKPLKINGIGSNALFILAAANAREPEKVAKR